MHKGEDTYYYLQMGYNVIAFEANPSLIEHCKNRFSYEIQQGRLTIIEGAIVSKKIMAGNSIIFYKSSNSVWGTVSKKWNERNLKKGAISEKIYVPIIDFENCIQEYGIPYYMKIDIEGMDIVCLNALYNFDTKPIYVSIESEKVSFINIKKEFQIFEDLGYLDFKIVNQADVEKLNINSHKGTQGFYHKFIFGSSGAFGEDINKKWISKQKALFIYFWIFIGYKIWGDNSKVKNLYFFKKLRTLISKHSNSTLPGWYDTHARHKSYHTI